MDYRDERDALRARQEALEEELTSARADAEGKAKLEEELAAKEKELAKLRAVAGPKQPRVGCRIAVGVAAAIGVVTLAVGAFTWLMMEGPGLDPEHPVSTSPAIESAAATASAGTSSSDPDPPGPRLRFSRSTGGLAPLPLDASGSDGVLAIVFDDSGSDRAYSAVALSGRPLVERWRVGPFGAEAPSVWSSGHRALIIDAAREAHVIDVDKGRELAVVSGLSDGAARVCMHNEQAWIAGRDDRAIGINLETGAGSVGAQLMKRECSALAGSNQTACASLSAALCGGNAPAVPEMAVAAVLADERVAVAVGLKKPGTPEVVAAGFDPKTRSIRWRSAIAPPDDDDDALPYEADPRIVAALDEELFVAVEALRSDGAKLRAFDAKTGERRFTYSFPSTARHPPLSVVLGVERVFATGGEVLYVVDRSSGKELARVPRP